MSKFNFRNARFTKNIIVNPLGSVILGILNLEHVVSGLPVAGSPSGETFAMEFCMRGIGVKLTQKGTFQVKFPEKLRMKNLLVDGNTVIDPNTDRKSRVADLDANGNEQWDADYFPITPMTRAAFTKYCASLAGIPEAIVEGRDALVAAIARGEVNASASTDAPAPAAGASAPAEFSV
jgi:hypothetical protein